MAGVALLLSQGGPISGFSADYTWWGQGRIEGVPVPVIIFVAAAVIAHVVLRQTRFGLHVYAVGGNGPAADLNGVDTRRVVFAVYVIIGFFCGLGSFLLSARLNSAEAVAGLGLELDVIAAVVIGGTSLFGGVGGVFGTVVGALLIGVLRNGLVLLNVSPFIQQIVIGVILVLAVAFDQSPRPGGGRDGGPEPQRIAKHFGAIQALQGVDLELERGEVLGLMGDNGAGKSTLVKIIAGSFAPSAGEVRIDGEPVAFARPLEARQKGIEIVYQDLALCDNLTAALNVFLGRELTGGGPVPVSRQRRR